MSNHKVPVVRTASYSFVARSFHWLTAILVLAAFILSAGGPDARVFGQGYRDLLILHESLGLTVFAVTLLRLAWRAFDAPPAPVPMPAWMLVASNMTHYLLYFLLAFTPLSAIGGSWLIGRPLSLYGMGDVASPWATSAALGQTILGMHTLAGDVVIWLAGIHAAAALYHHFILKDRVLRSMLISQK